MSEEFHERARNSYLIKVIATDRVNAGEDFSYGTFTVTIPGDINADFRVDSLDLYALGKAYDSTPGSLNWNVNADINKDLIVNVVDLELLRKNYGKKAT